MPRNLFEQIDKEEKKRIAHAAETFKKNEKISLSEIVGTETIQQILNRGPRLWANSFPEAKTTLPLNSVIYSTILNLICPKCSCSKNPALIKPYLERGVILPVLSNPLSQYPTDFANLIIQYPYLGEETYRFLRFVRRESSDEKGGICTNCYFEKWTEILKSFDKLPIDEKLKEALRTGYGLTAFWLYPAQRPEVRLLESIEDSVKKEDNLKAFLPLAESAWTLSNLRSSQIFRAIPQVGQSDLFNIDQALRDKYSYKGASLVQDKEFALRALNIDYNPSLPIEQYLDIILPRKKKINSLIDEIILSDNKQKVLSRIEEEIWQINNEISSSKKIELLTFTTNFVFNNAPVLSTMLIGALIGYVTGNFAGCGAGSAGGFIAGEGLQRLSGKLGKFKIRDYPRKTTEWIKARLEGTEERMLATILSKDIKTVQVWSLRRKLKK